MCAEEIERAVETGWLKVVDGAIESTVEDLTATLA